MNLRLAHKLIGETERKPQGFYVLGREAAREVHLMAKAGLINAQDGDQGNLKEAIITRITHAGHQSYRALNNVPSFSRS